MSNPSSTLPAKCLQSQAVRSSLRANIIPLVNSKAQALSCRALWYEQKGNKNIAVQRYALDQTVSEIDGVEFFISCITGTKTNLKQHKDVRPGIAYFIVYLPNKKTNEETIFKAMHEKGFDAEITTIRTLKKDETPAKSMWNVLQQVVKDHNSSFAKDLLRSCLADCDDIETRKANVKPCRFVVVNGKFEKRCGNACRELVKDGLKIDAVCCMVKTKPVVDVEPSTKLGQALETIRSVLQKSNHALYRGEIYRRAPKSSFTFEHMCSVNCYLQSLISVPALQDDVIVNLTPLQNILANPDCQVITQLQFNYDMIEVLEKKCFKLSSRCFVDAPFSGKDVGKISPRSFHAISPRIDVMNAGCFETSIQNSFPDKKTRVNFLNKLYQCLLYKQLPQKTKKLVACGESNSGKTSWGQLFFGLLGKNHVSTIAKEKNFALSMLDDNTQVVLIDEWSDDSLPADVCKIFFQGGYVVQTKKYQQAKTVNNECGIYITCNAIPNFGPEQENVLNRLDVYFTASLKKMNPSAPQWIKENAMRCLLWMVKEIEENKNYIDTEELFYEKVNDEFVDENTVTCHPLPLDELEKLKNLSFQDIADSCNQKRICEDLFDTVVPPSPVSQKTSDLKSPDVHFDDEVPGPSTYTPPETPGKYLFFDDMQYDSTNVPDLDVQKPESPVEFYGLELPKRKLLPEEVNITPYHREVRRTIVTYMDYGDEEQFTRHRNCYKEFCLMKERLGGLKYDKPDPTYDAWIIIQGECRKYFDCRKLIERYPSLRERIKRIREICTIRLPWKHPSVISEKDFLASAYKNNTCESNEKSNDHSPFIINMLDAVCDDGDIPEKAPSISMTGFSEVSTVKYDSSVKDFEEAESNDSSPITVSKKKKMKVISDSESNGSPANLFEILALDEALKNAVPQANKEQEVETWVEAVNNPPSITRKRSLDNSDVPLSTERREKFVNVASEPNHSQEQNRDPIIGNADERNYEQFNSPPAVRRKMPTENTTYATEDTDFDIVYSVKNQRFSIIDLTENE